MFTFALLLWLVPVIFLAGVWTLYAKIGIATKTSVFLQLLVVLIPGLGVVSMWNFMRASITKELDK